MHITRDDIILTDKARVASIQLNIGEESPWHLHSEVTENVICLNGQIKLQYGSQGEFMVLSPGQRHEVPPKKIHNLINLSNEKSAYLLVQNGAYDFIPSNS